MPYSDIKIPSVVVGQGGKLKHVDHCEDCGSEMFTYAIVSEGFYCCIEET